MLWLHTVLLTHQALSLSKLCSSCYIAWSSFLLSILTQLANTHSSLETLSSRYTILMKFLWLHLLIFNLLWPQFPKISLKHCARKIVWSTQPISSNYSLPIHMITVEIGILHSTDRPQWPQFIDREWFMTQSEALTHMLPLGHSTSFQDGHMIQNGPLIL